MSYLTNNGVYFFDTTFFVFTKLGEFKWQIEYSKPKVVFIENMHLATHLEMLIGHGIKVVCMDPIPSEFDETNYLLKNKDVANAVKNKIFQSGYHHFILHGINENRKRELKI